MDGYSVVPLSEPPRETIETQAIIHARAWVSPREEGSTFQFIISKRDLEEQAKLKLRELRTYSIKGRIGDICDFEVERWISNDRYIHLYLPKRFAVGVKLHETYRIVIFGIEQKGRARRTGKDSGGPHELERSQYLPGNDGLDRRKEKECLATVIAKAYSSQAESRIPFVVRKPRLEKLTGISFREGKNYLISGSNGTICNFLVKHRESRYGNTLCISVPKEHLCDFKSGEKYTILVKSIEEQVCIERGTRLNSHDIWDWKLLAAWIDTEGTYQSNPRNASAVVITQKEREPLDGIRSFLARDRILSTLSLSSKHDQTYYHLKTTGGVEALARIVKKTEQYIVTENKRSQIRRFKEKISNTASRDNVFKRRAREILGIEGR